jgi:hypothetical protein
MLSLSSLESSKSRSQSRCARGVGEGLCRVWSRLSTVLKGFLDLCFSGEERKSKHKHSSNLKKLIIESSCVRNFYFSLTSIKFIFFKSSRIFTVNPISR